MNVLYKKRIAICCEIKHDTHKLTLSAKSRILSVKSGSKSSFTECNVVILFFSSISVAVSSPLHVLH